MSKLRLASSIILTRGSNRTPQIYLVQRAPQLRFMGGFWAFPGGTIIKEDHTVEDESVDSAFINCGLRELFEETGLLLGTLGSKLDDAERKQLRQELLEDTSLLNWLRVLATGSISSEEISVVCNITTPTFAPVRYKTRFLHVILPDDARPSIEIGELVQGEFFEPADAIAAWENGELLIAPPNLFLLRQLAKYGLPEFKNEANIQTQRFDAGALHPVYFSPGIFMASLKTPTLPPATTTNTLIVGSEKLFVVEPATYEKDEQQHLFDKMDELIGEGKQFEAILLTHYHMDHVGAVNAISQRYKLPVRAHPLTYDKIPHGFIKGQALNEGDRIELGTSPDGQSDWHLDIIHTPGHTNDHICYLENRYQSALVGDMLSTSSTILIDPPEGHMRSYLNSLKRLQSYPIKTLYPSHGTVHSDGSNLIKKYLEHRQKREHKVIAALTTSLQTLAEIVPSAYDDVTEETYSIAERSLLAGLIKLEDEGVCEVSDNRWRLSKS